VANDRTVTLVLDAVDKGMGKSLDQAGDKAEKSSGRMARASKGAQLALVAMGAGAIAMGKDAIGSASDLQETISKSSVVLGSAAGSVQEWSKTSATSLGQSRQQALDAATSFAAFGKSAGLTGKDLGKFSTDMVTLTSDMASFSNTSPEEAIEAVGAALRGETEPIRKYNVLLDDATLRNEALTLGLIKNTKTALTPQQKVLAAQSQILKQTKDAQGDFGRTAENAANRQKILTARISDAKAKIGSGLLPAYNSLLGVGLKLVDYSAKHGTQVKILAGVVVGLTVAVAAANVGTKVYMASTKLATAVTTAWGWAMGTADKKGRLVAASTKIWAAGQWLLNAALTANPIGIVIVAIAALAAALVIAWKRSSTFRAIVKGAFDGIKSAASGMWKGVKSVLGFLVDKYLSVMGALVNGAAKAFGWIPGLGPKMKRAAAAFNREAKKIRDGIRGIPSQKQINITISTKVRDQTGWYDPRNHGINIPAPKKAAGGPVAAGMPYVVGEHRPELFVPRQTGRILPYVPSSGGASGGASGGSSSPIYIMGDVYGFDDFAAKVDQAQMRRRRQGRAAPVRWGGA